MFFASSSIYAQYTTLDFESAANGSGFSWTYFNNAGGIITTPANPVSGGSNTSATVLQYDMKQAADPWQGAFTDDIDPFTFDGTNTMVTIKVNKAVTSPFELKFESNNGGPVASVIVSNTTTNTWETLTFDYSSFAGNGFTYYRMVIVPDFDAVTYGPGAGRLADYPLYIDDINVPTANIVAPTTVNVTFQVNAANITTHANGLYLAGGTQFGSFNTNPMSDANMDDVWEITMAVTKNMATNYTFVNGGTGWGDKENIVGQSCADGVHSDRLLPAVWGDTTIMACFEDCSLHDGSCGVVVPPSNVTFSVDMSDYTANAFTTVYISGFFNGWSQFGNPLTDDGGGKWSITLPLTNGTEQYKFQLDGWANQEDLTAGGACITNGNRSVTFAADMTVPEVCFEACVTCAELVPVELTYFNAKMEGNTNVLSWETATEEGNSHFEVERSIDGKSFEVVGNVEGNGTVYEVINYEFIDENPAANTYYRLRQVDFDGAFEYTNIVNVKRGQVASTDIKVYPNPVQDRLTVDYTSNINENVLITVADITGRILISQSRTVVDGGNQLNINLNDLPEGSYVIRLQSNSNTTIQTIVKQ